jgi:hypothetical protein
VEVSYTLVHEYAVYLFSFDFLQEHRALDFHRGETIVYSSKCVYLQLLYWSATLVSWKSGVRSWASRTRNFDPCERPIWPRTEPILICFSTARGETGKKKRVKTRLRFSCYREQRNNSDTLYSKLVPRTVEKENNNENQPSPYIYIFRYSVRDTKI